MLKKAKAFSRKLPRRFYHFFLRQLRLWNRGMIQEYVQELLTLQHDQLQKKIMQQRQTLASLWQKQRDIKGQEKAPQPHTYDSLAGSLSCIEKWAPTAYELWQKCQAEGEKSYENEPVDSCSIEGHSHAKFFQNFSIPYFTGTVLDIGCGPQPVPSYLSGYPVQLIAGIDPIPSEDHPFVFAKGIAEILPWSDQSFDTVVIATSLDHVILLDRVFSEVHRVLKPGGHFIAWVSFTPNAPEYHPYDKELVPYDKFHLFHFDRPWFENMLQKQFDVVETYDFFVPTTQNVYEAFYALQVKDN